MALVKVPGVLYDFNGRQLVLAPLNMGALRQLLDRLKSFGLEPSSEQIDTLVDAVYASLKRNYPSITRDDVENDLVDASNAEELMPIIMNRSGLDKTNNDALPQTLSGEAPSQGVATLGLTSTPTSPPPPAGPSST